MGARYYDGTSGRFLSPDPLGHSASMDLYSFADGDPLNNFDADGRLFHGTLNGAGLWGSERYAGMANALDAVIKPFALMGARLGLGNQVSAELNWNGGYEADFRYMRNFERGSDAFRMGHQLGYAGAEMGFQVAMFAGPAAFGRIASGAAAGGGMSAAIGRSGGAMSYGITRTAPAVTPNAMRERVLANLAESAKARQSSNFDKFLAGERRVSVSGDTAVRRSEQLDLLKQDIKGHWWGCAVILARCAESATQNEQAFMEIVRMPLGRMTFTQ